MKEIWKPICGYEGLYEVSNIGRIRSLDRRVKNRHGFAVKKGKLIATAKVSGNDYRKVSLWKNNKGENALVHRIVAQAFVPNPDDLPEVNHKDENKENNNADNLEWCDRIYNANYGTSIQRIVEKRKGVPVGEQPIIQFTKDGLFVARHESAMKAAESVGGSNSAIGKCANGRSKTSYGYVWAWENGNIKTV